MIYTVTMNPSVEFVTGVSDFQLNQINTSKFDLMLPSGKGINVSRILKQLGLPSIATGFTGGYTGEFIEDWLKREDIKSEFIDIDDNTRINVQIIGDTNSTIESKGPSISHQKLQELLYYLSRVKEGDIVFLSTSFPRNITESVINRMIAICKSNKANFVMDIDEYYLEEFLEQGPIVSNVSVKCLEHIFKTDIKSEKDLLDLKDKIFSINSKFIIVPFVDNKVYLFANKEIYSFAINEKYNEKKEPYIDSIIAGFIGTYIRTSDYLESFKMGNAAANATLKTKDLAKKYQIKNMYENIEIQKLN